MANVRAMNSRFFLAVSLCVFCLVSGGVVKRSDDVNQVLENLQNLVQQQAAVISSVLASQTALQNKFTELENKLGSLSQPVAFSARFSSDNFDAGIPLSHNAILKFDQAITNGGNGYNPTNGIFTAPVAGYYAFFVVLMEPNGATHSHLTVSIVKNGAVVDQAFVENSGSTSAEQGSTNTLLHLAVGDQVWVRQETGDGVRGSFWSVFTGFLVQAE